MNSTMTGGEFSDAPTVARRKLSLPTMARSFVLTVVDGPDRGKKFTFSSTEPRALIGKSIACRVQLTDPEVSRRHIAVEVRGERMNLTDLGSTNGTIVNGVMVTQATLAGGENLVIGATTFRVEALHSVDAQQLSTETHFGRVLGASDAMRRLYPLCRRLAANDVPITIEGETGSGKEHLAEALTEQSRRATGPYVVFDCTAVAPNMVEVELFGDERGGGFGGPAGRQGVFERAHGGTLLIDEIGELPMDHQARLLRVLERFEVLRVGGATPIRVDVRIIATTRRNLDQAVQQGRFREDLFHRLAVGRIELPPLRERDGDIELLARHFCSQLRGDPTLLNHDVLANFRAYTWPGNVRELRNAVARRLVLGDLSLPLTEGAEDVAEAAPTQLGADKDQALIGRGDSIARVLALSLPLADARQRIVSEFEQRYCDHILAQHNGNVSRAAAAAGVARRHLQRIRAKFRT